MNKEAKRVMYFLGALCLVVSILGVFSGCKFTSDGIQRLIYHDGVQGLIYHDGVLIAKTNCDFDLTLEMNTTNVIVKSITTEFGERRTREKYQYVNDGNYRVERKACKY